MPTFVQTYNDQGGAALTWAKNGGVLPTPYASQVKVFQNGQVLVESTQYGISGSTITIGDSVHISGSTYVVYAEATVAGSITSGLDCLDGIIGLDSIDCPCFEDSRPDDYNVSSSGYYLTDPEYGVPMQDGILASAECGQGDLWDVLIGARDKAKIDFPVDIDAALKGSRSSLFYPWNGMIGNVKSNRNRTINNDYAGQVIKPKRRMRHQKQVITDIYLGVNFDGDIDVQLNSNAFGFTPLTETITAISGQFVKHTLASPWELDLYQLEVPDLYYTISYSTGGNTVLSNEIWCCGTPGWSNNVQAFGFDGDAITSDFSGSCTSNKTGNGLAFKSHTYCDEMAWVCELNQLGGKNMKSLIGRCLQYKSSVKILSQMLESGKINQFTLLDANQGFQKMAYFQDRYNELITYIAQNLPSGYSGCYGCGNNTITVRDIRT